MIPAHTPPPFEAIQLARNCTVLEVAGRLIITLATNPDWQPPQNPPEGCGEGLDMEEPTGEEWAQVILAGQAITWRGYSELLGRMSVREWVAFNARRLGGRDRAGKVDIGPLARALGGLEGGKGHGRDKRYRAVRRALERVQSGQHKSMPAYAQAMQDLEGGERGNPTLPPWRTIREERCQCGVLGDWRISRRRYECAYKRTDPISEPTPRPVLDMLTRGGHDFLDVALAEMAFLADAGFILLRLHGLQLVISLPFR